jgi:hypothetical protein
MDSWVAEYSAMARSQNAGGLTRDARLQLESIARARSTPRGLVLRTRIALAARLGDAIVAAD